MLSPGLLNLEDHQMTRVALIDIGTNTIRLLVGEAGGNDKLRFLHHEVIRTRLGEGLSERGTISSEAIQRTVDALIHFKEVIAGYQVRIMEAYATAWARAASNTDEMVSEMARLNLPIWILTEQEEALM